MRRNHLCRIIGIAAIGIALYNNPVVTFPASEGAFRTVGGLHQYSFQTPHGMITVNFPADAAVGSVISGTVVRTPAGNNPQAAETNRAQLNGYVVEVPELRRDPLENSFTLLWPADALRETQVSIRAVSGYSARAKGFVPLPAPGETAIGAYQLPNIGQTGQTVQVPGMFDGNCSNTTATINGRPATILAESPRQMVFAGPSEPVGMTTLKVSEQGQTMQVPYRNVDIALSAPKTQLSRGETTRLTVQVTGLQNLEREISVRLVTTGTIQAEGGNSQVLTVRPADIGSDGQLTVERTLTGTRAGIFNVTGSVILPLVCNLAGQMVHVEGKPSGSTTTGDFYLPVKLPGGKIFRLWIKSKEKPKLKYCDWILINACDERDDGAPVTDDWKKVPPPEPKPRPRPPTTPKPPATPDPVPLGGGNPPDAPMPPPCKDGEERSPSTADKRSFEVLAAWSKPEASFTWDAAPGQRAAIGLGDFFEKGAAVGEKIGDRLPETPGTGPATLLLKYLDGGAKILKGVAQSPIAYRASKVGFSITIETLTYSASKWTVEVCRKGIWVRETRCEKSKTTSSVFKDDLTIANNDRDWEKICNSSNEAYLNPDRLNDFFTAWVKGCLEKLAANPSAYEEFIKDCPN